MALGLVSGGAVAAAAVPSGPVVGGGSASYTEQAAPTPIGADVTVSGGGSFAGESIGFAVDGATSSESLSLQSVGSPVVTDGVVSVSGGSVYLGNGASADIIGSVDATADGQAGRALRVNFTSAFVNAGFESAALTGWTALNQQIDLGVTSIAGSVTQDTSTYPGPVPNQDNNVPEWLGDLSTTIQSSIVSDGSYALQLTSSGMTTYQGYDVVHGPAVYSSPFQAAAGDSIYFDWRAYAGDDDYHVFGYLLDQAGNQVEVLDSTGAGTTDWTTKETVIPSSGTYRFVFVAGTFDASGGTAAGASLVIDNVRVYGTKAVDVVVQQIARLLTYASSSDNPPATRTVAVTAQSLNGSGTADITVAITPVDDAPSVGALAPLSVTNTEGPQTYANLTGTATSTDPEGDVPSYALVGGAADVRTIGGVAYTSSVTGTYGTLHLNATTGDYVLVPNASAIDARLTDDTESFGLTVTSNALSGSGAIVLGVSVPASAPGVPSGLVLVPGAGQVQASWVAPTWLGGSAIQRYLVQTSADGTVWATSVITPDATPTARVSGLSNGALVHVRVLAVNSTGTGAASAGLATTPVDVPGAPSDLAATPASRTVALAWTAPGVVGGTAITGYRVETSTDGSTWSVAIADTGSTSTSATVTGLSNGTATTFRVSAINAVGTGLASASVTVTPRTVPSEPTGLALVAADSSLMASWAAPSDNGGSAVTAYRVETSVDGTTWTTAGVTAARTYQLTGLSNGATVKVRVSAVNEAGTSAASASASSTPRTVPGTPTITAVEAGNRSLTVAFTPPASDGGSAILTYQYSLDGGLTWVARRTGSTASPLVIGGLDNGSTYSVMLRAVNEAGTATGSQESSGVAPALAPVPVVGLAGPVIPELSPGASVLLVDGVTTAVDVSTADGTVVASGDGFTATFEALTRGGSRFAVDAATGRLVIGTDGSVRASGAGFRPGSTVDVWLFSTPYLLGEITVAADGTFSAVLPVPAGVAAGDHTVQLNGVGADGSVRSLDLGVVLTAPAAAGSSALASTGSDAGVLLLVALVMVGMGAVLVAVPARRRARPAMAVAAR